MTLDHILLLWNIGQLLPQPLQVSDLQRELRESFQPDLVQHKGCYSSAAALRSCDKEKGHELRRE